MRNIFIALIIAPCLLTGAVEAKPQKGRSRTKTSMKSERELLLDECHIVAAIINEKHIPGGQFGSPGHKRAVKRGITLYLISVGTPQARKLLDDLENDDFKGFV